MDAEFYVPLYLGIISAVSLLLVVQDKRAAKTKKWRVPESLLMFFAFIGGATAMYVTMHIIRHKTKRRKFMVGLPRMIFVHIIALLIFYYVV